MSGRFAKQTEVSVQQSRAELESMLAKYGGEAFAYAMETNRVMIGFRIVDEAKRRMSVRIVMPIPPPSEERFTHSSVGPRREDTARKMWEQECRALWRALVLVIRAKLEACAIGISTYEREFMADLVMPNGQTMTEMLGAQMRKALETNDKTPLMLIAARS